MSPWYFVYERMGKWLLPYLSNYPLQDLSNTVCGNCGTRSDEWPTPNSGFPGYKDSYGTEMDICEACLTLYESSIDAMGIEHNRKTGPIPNKFGMWASVAVLAETDKLTIFMPGKIADKLPEGFPLDVVVATKAEMRELIYTRDIHYPAVYIADLGKRKKDLVESIQFSTSDHHFVTCSADKTSYLDLHEIKQAMACYSNLDTKNQAIAARVGKSLYLGSQTPEELGESLADNDDVRQFIAAMGRDPYQRKFILRELR